MSRLTAEPAAQPTARLTAELTVTRGELVLRTDLRVDAGQVLAVLGPNGAGKTTLLRALAGLLAIDAGRIAVGGEVWDDGDAFVPADRRRVGLVFQDYRLFPHLSVLDNVAFAIRARAGTRTRGHARDRVARVRRAAARVGAEAVLHRLGIAELAPRRPAQLSGGQAQRVALARALAGDPALLLLDEPLAALDARTRLQTRTELRHALADFPGPSVLVTHDPLEAMVLADRILVLEAGRVVQTGAPAEVARRPATDYVAHLVGLNLYQGRMADRAGHRIELDRGGQLIGVGQQSTDADATADATADAADRVLVAVAPSAISIHVREPEPGSARNRWPGRVSGLELLTDRVRVAVQGTPDALVDVTQAAVADLGLHPGVPVWLTAKATEVIVYPDPAHVSG